MEPTPVPVAIVRVDAHDHGFTTLTRHTRACVPHGHTWHEDGVMGALRRMAHGCPACGATEYRDATSADPVPA